MIYKNFLILIIVLFVHDINAQKIKFKDENLKSALLQLGYDFNKDKEIDISEIDTVTNLKISERNIKKLDDIIHFKSLKSINAMTNQIENLDIFHGNSMLEEIYIGENKLGKKLTLNNLKNLKGLYAFRNGIEEIQFVNTNNIQSLYLQGNPLEKLDVSDLPKLKSLQLSNCNILKEIDVTHNPELIQLHLTSTEIKTLDISKNPLLKTLYVEKNVVVIKGENPSQVKPMPRFIISD